MKTIGKTLGGLGALLLLAGALLALTGWLMGGRTVRSTPRLPFFEHGLTTSKTWELVDKPAGGTAPGEPGDWLHDGADHLPPFHSVEVDVDLGSVTIEPGESFGVSLSWLPGSADYTLSYAVKDQTLTIWSDSPGGLNLNPVVPAPDGEITVFLPEGTRLQEVDLDLDLGDAYLTGFQVRDLSLDCDLGEAALSQVEADEADLSLDLGSLALTACRFGDADLSLSMGDLTASDLAVSGDLTVDSDAGSVEIAGVLGRTTDISADLGSVVAAVDLPRADCGYDLYVELGSLTVDGEDYRHTAVRGGGTHQIQIKADMGDIELSFTR